MVIALFRWGDPGLNQVFSRPFGYLCRKIIGIELKILHPENGTIHRPAVILGNHQSSMDLGIMWAACPLRTVIVAKKELKHIPIFGWFFVAAGNLLIDRSKTQDAKKQIAAMVKLMKEKNLNLAIFPEGTRNRHKRKADGTEGLGILPFKKGAFHLAVNTGFPLVPVVCSSLEGKAVWENFDLKGGKILISVLEPIQTEGIKPTEVSELQERVYHLMVNEYNRLNELLDPKTKSSARKS